MKVLITLAETVPDEINILQDFAQGFDKIHLRKPEWSVEQTRSFLKGAREIIERIVLCDHFELTNEFDVGGIHFKEHLRDSPFNSDRSINKSTSVHKLDELSQLDNYDYVLFGPVFPSFSKQNYLPGYSENEIIAALKGKKPTTLAIGGIDERTGPNAMEMGFDGYATLTSFWKEHVEEVS